MNQSINLLSHIISKCVLLRTRTMLVNLTLINRPSILCSLHSLLPPIFNRVNKASLRSPDYYVPLSFQFISSISSIHISSWTCRYHSVKDTHDIHLHLFRIQRKKIQSTCESWSNCWGSRFLVKAAFSLPPLWQPLLHPCWNTFLVCRGLGRRRHCWQ